MDAVNILDAENREGARSTSCASRPARPVRTKS
jgi:hypothetical protein